MPGLSAADVAKRLAEIGQRLELQSGNPYRARAYRRAAENLSLLPVSLDALIAQDRLTEIAGVGDALARVIAEIHRTGTHPILKGLRKEAPESLLELLRLPGMRPDRIAKLHKQLGITSLAELEEAAKSDRLKTAKGFGPAFQAKVLQSIGMRRSGREHRHLHRAAQAVAYAEMELGKSHPELTEIAAAGEFRRGCELVSAIVLVAADPSLRGPCRALHAGGQLTVEIAAPARYGAALLFATGSQEHIAALQALAAKKGFTLDASGLKKHGKTIASEIEEDIYSALGLAFIAPELRETGAEVALAAKGKLPSLVTDADITGVLHAHTDQSDGADTLDEMAAATRRGGYAYLGMTDHSQTASYAGGLTPSEVLTQQQAIDRLNLKSGKSFRVFKGIESDILPDGSLDYSDDILERFDFIVASVHSRFRMEKKEQTERILRAVANPHTTILGHVTGRQLLRRPGYEVDMEKILRACADNGVAIEINANPWRLDLDWRWCERALELGCMVSIDPDAHSTAEIANIHWGVLMARKGAVPKTRVLNALPLDEFAKHLDVRKRSLAQKRGKRRAKAGAETVV